jgi:hypothetical protein
MRVASADTYAETAWKDGKMVFRREKFETITEKLSRKFGTIFKWKMKNCENTYSPLLSRRIAGRNSLSAHTIDTYLLHHQQSTTAQ